jgi:hypothetical protein
MYHGGPDPDTHVSENQAYANMNVVIDVVLAAAFQIGFQQAVTNEACYAFDEIHLCSYDEIT